MNDANIRNLMKILENQGLRYERTLDHGSASSAISFSRPLSPASIVPGLPAFVAQIVLPIR